MLEYTVTLRVRYKETDQMQVAYYSNYFVWFEVARADLFREIGYTYKDIEEKLGLWLMVVEASCQYKMPAKYDDLLNIRCRVAKIGASSLTFEYKVLREKDLLAIGKTAHVFTDKSARPKRIPLPLLEVLK